MTSIGFQLYSVHAVDDPFPTVIERVGDTGFEGVEFVGLGHAGVDEVRRALDRLIGATDDVGPRSTSST